MMMKTLLNAAEIAARVPHHGTMCLLHALHESSDTHVLCSTTSHQAADNPLRSASGLLSCNAIEYAAQAMALHGAMTSPASNAPQGGRLASVRSVKLHVPRLDTVAGPLFGVDTRSSRGWTNSDPDQPLWSGAGIRAGR